MLSLANPDMSACGRHEQNPFPENTSFLESLSSRNPIINDTIPWSASPFKKNESWKASSTYSSNSDKGATCAMNSESLQLCTEGLGFESLDGVEELKNDASCSRLTSMPTSTSVRTPKQYKRCIRSFPPPISSLGRAGCFKSYRQDGRFVLQEVRIPTRQRCFHACREDGRLRLSFVHSDDDDDDNDDDGEEENNEVLEDD